MCDLTFLLWPDRHTGRQKSHFQNFFPFQSRNISCQVKQSCSCNTVPLCKLKPKMIWRYNFSGWNETHVRGLFVVVYIVHVSGETEVGDLHNIVLRHKDVSGCQVSVDTLRGEVRIHQTHIDTTHCTDTHISSYTDALYAENFHLPLSDFITRTWQILTPLTSTHETYSKP